MKWAIHIAIDFSHRKSSRKTFLYQASKEFTRDICTEGEEKEGGE